MWAPTFAELQAADKVKKHGMLRKGAFAGDATLTKVVLPDGVTSIEGGRMVGVSSPDATACRRLHYLPRWLQSVMVSSEDTTACRRLHCPTRWLPSVIVPSQDAAV